MIELRGLHKTFDKGSAPVEAVRNIDLTVARGSIVSLIGPSGCGKSTLLHMIAGLYEPSSGDVIYNGRSVDSVNTATGYMTQKDTLFPWRTVRDNVALPSELAGKAKADRHRQAADILGRVGLDGFETRYPSELSGGMRKRAALARMLIYRPETFLLDEPFGALDAQLKLAMHELLLRLWTEDKQTILLVTHDLVEAITLSDRVIVLTRRPSRIILDQEIDLPRPRDVQNVRFSPRFKEIYDQLWDFLRLEYEEERL
ncbi:MAG: ABC transporter ATP-binding protein [Pseudolabrys sp.]|nr:ABC transporter ATP-binding protein [Pseudolabrys sp.]